MEPTTGSINAKEADKHFWEEFSTQIAVWEEAPSPDSLGVVSKEQRGPTGAWTWSSCKVPSTGQKFQMKETYEPGTGVVISPAVYRMEEFGLCAQVPECPRSNLQRYYFSCSQAHQEIEWTNPVRRRYRGCCACRFVVSMIVVQDLALAADVGAFPDDRRQSEVLAKLWSGWAGFHPKTPTIHSDSYSGEVGTCGCPRSQSALGTRFPGGFDW
ncbi:hypothetical protein BDR22DRAFT_917659 [Usnea florida]